VTDAASGSDWFTGAGLGVFVHWDHASQQGLEISWPLVGGSFALPRCQSVTVEQYHSSAATFDPTAWDATAFARLLRASGATYAVLTAKHHSGYAMFHTRRSSFSVEHSPFGRDIVREFVDAVRAEGLRAGLYFSLSDWSAPDYPPFTEADKPYRFGASPPAPGPERWERYLDFLFGQVTELLTNYGRIDVLWFDGGWERPAHQWRAGELLDHIRSLQPDILVNDRLPGVGDFRTPEQFVPAQPPGGAWEACMTMNESWGYNPGDTQYKPARRLVHALCEVAGRGGNLLLNVSPRGDGTLPPEQVERLQAIGRWLAANGESITGTTPGLEPWQCYGPSTRRGDRVYVHLLMRPYDHVTVRGMPIRRVRSVRALATGTDLAFTTRTGIIESLIDDPRGELTIEVPVEVVDDDATVLAIDLAPEEP
jgi:alpha-L-fucosidase